VVTNETGSRLSGNLSLGSCRKEEGDVGGEMERNIIGEKTQEKWDGDVCVTI